MIALNKERAAFKCWDHIGKELKKDPEVCKLAVSTHYAFIRDSSYLLKNDK